jgi:Na+-transporting NADH:ubiquinone oxidoreductase subunit NqrE
LVFVVCALAALAVVLAVIVAFRPHNQADLLAVLPMAALNTAVLGPLLISATRGYSFIQAMGFALGSGLGYAFAVLLTTEGERKMQSRSVPPTFKGLPIKLIYVGILSMAIYALTGAPASI